MPVTETHEEKETLSVDVNLPGHDTRVTTALFTHTRKLLLERTGGRCWVCGCTADEVGPIEAHHHPIERAFAEMIDWERVQRDFPAFDWAKFWEGAETVTESVPASLRAPGEPETITRRKPRDPYLFVDDMTVNGLPLCKAHHIGKDEGIHALPYPIFLAQRYGRAGYQFSAVETIHHEA